MKERDVIMHKFDEIVNRRGTDSVKWNGQTTKYSSNDLFPMWVADTDFKTDTAIIDAIVARAKHGVFGYTSAEGLCHDAIIDWHQSRNNIVYSSESIGFSPSVLTTIQLLLHTVTEESDHVMIVLPTYGPFHSVTTNAKRQVVGVNLLDNDGKYMMDYEAMEGQIIAHDVKAFILCNPHNPTGRVWSEVELQKILEICKKHNVFVISDEIHGDIIMPGEKFTPAMSVARGINYADQIAIVTSPTKTFNLASIQVSYFMVDNPALKIEMQEKANYLGVMLGVNVFGLHALCAAYAHGASYVDTLNSYIYTNYEYLLTTVLSHYPTVRVTALEATYLVWVDLSALQVSEDEVQAAMQAAGISVQTKTDFFEEGTLHMRVNVATPFAQLVQGVEYIVAGLAKLTRK